MRTYEIADEDDGFKHTKRIHAIPFSEQIL